MVRTGTFAALRNALSVIASNFGTVLVLCVVGGVVGSLCSGTVADLAVDVVLRRDFATYLVTKGGMSADVAAQVAAERAKAFHADPAAFQAAYPQMFALSKSMTLMFTSSLATALADAVWMGLYGAVAASATIYLWVQRERQRSASLYDAVNYALSRWKRVVGPHFRSVLMVMIGSQVLVPGVLFGMQRAFVDAIATIDDRETDPAARSKRLTASRRGLVLQTFAVSALWWVPYAFVGTFLLMDPVASLTPYVGAVNATTLAPFVAPLTYVVTFFVLAVMDLCMVQYYLDMFRKTAPPVPGPVDLTKPAVPAS